MPDCAAESPLHASSQIFASAKMTTQESVPGKILIADDEPHNRKLLRTVLEREGYATCEAANGVEVLESMPVESPDIILLDIMMPDMDGFEVTERLKSDPATSEAPIILITALNDRDSRIRGLQAGAEEFLTKPVNSAELKMRVRNLLRLNEYSTRLRQYNQELDETVQERRMQLKHSLGESIYSLTLATSLHEAASEKHIIRIRLYALRLAEAFGMDESFCDHFGHASAMHDIGKIGISDAILTKPGELSPEELELVRTHTTIGKDILSNNSAPYFQMAQEIAHSHHECWDGSGYPFGLKGEDIPLSGRLMKLIDVYDALRGKLCYNPESLSHVQAIEVLKNGDDRSRPDHFDPKVLSCFLSNADAFEEIYQSHPD